MYQVSTLRPFVRALTALCVLIGAGVVSIAADGAVTSTPTLSVKGSTPPPVRNNLPAGGLPASGCRRLRWPAPRRPSATTRPSMASERVRMQRHGGWAKRRWAISI